MARWKIGELQASGTLAWANPPSQGLNEANFSTDSDGLKFFHIDYNPTSLSEDNQNLLKRFDTINNEQIRVETFRPNGSHATITYDMKLRYQDQDVYNKLKFLYNNVKEIYLYTADNTKTNDFKRYHLVIDDLSVDWVTVKSNQRFYDFSLKLTDASTDSTLNPIKFRFEEILDRPWQVDFWNQNNYNLLEKYTQDNNDIRYILSDFSPSSLNETYRRKGSDNETINGKIIRISPIQIDKNGKISRVKPIKSMSFKLEYQTSKTYDLLKELYVNYETFALYGNNDKTEFFGNMVIEDFSVDYVAARGTNRLYGINIQVREVDNGIIGGQ